ncbi:hypothetical protein N7509_011753 [Penicillium cosmopolitanum]|uniref:Uncharacterized protein n=1 Tax=Penicillium cosmopolitanum TaxID=1131564 RepID=A0A9W9SJZ7_9EURO|nr:uncharacterized protein N7509_011753 [Penicillium cosmopolitanum]KAJ5378634.1 hypothetical protein N7509_011753 [Penicillium cosmopolitanum]
MQATPFDGPRITPRNSSPHAKYVSKPWRLMTAASAILLLLGYLILPVVFSDADDTIRIDQTASTVFALFFIGIGYTGSIAIAFFQRRKKIFLLRSVFVPYLTINLLSLFNVIFNILGRGLVPLSALRVVGIGLPSTFSVIYGLSAFLMYREYSPHDEQGEDDTPLLVRVNPEDLTRTQLRRLLEERNSGAPSPDIVHSTYRLDLPGMEPPQKTWDRQSSPPTSRTWSSTGRTMA